MDGKDLEMIALLPDSEEYNKIKNEFLHSSKHKDVSPVQVEEVYSTVRFLPVL